MRTLIVLGICSALVVSDFLDSRAKGRDRGQILRSGAVTFCVGLCLCWVLVYVVGIFDGWKYSLR